MVKTAIGMGPARLGHSYVATSRVVGSDEPKRGHQLLAKTLLVMKLTILLLTAGFLNVYAKGLSQYINFSGQDVPLESVFFTVEKQTGFVFMYKENLLKVSRSVTIHAKGLPLEEFLSEIFKTQPLDFIVKGKSIFISRKPSDGQRASGTAPSFYDSAAPPPGELKGKVVTREGEPLSAASVVHQRSGKGTTTDADGNFSLEEVQIDDIIVVSYTGYRSKSIKVSDFISLTLVLEPAINELDQVITQAYGQTTRRLNTGNISKVSKEEIEKQPVSNVLATLEGRVPGMEVVQTNGLPGGGFKVLIRGFTSVGALSNELPVSNEPLYIIDGVPFAPNNTSQTRIGTDPFGGIGSGALGFSPFASINPADIESIEILKDADATAIYGSRGANGVVLVTTKKGKPGKTSVDVRAYTGVSKSSRSMKLLTTPQYLQMRREAFVNDNAAVFGDEFTVYDSTKSTDFADLFLGEPAYNSNIYLSLSGGNKNTNFRIGSTYNRENTIYPGDAAGQKFLNENLSFNLNLNHSSANNKLRTSFNSIYSTYRGNLAFFDPTSSIGLPPNYPDFFDDNGNLVWEYNGVQLANPYAALYRKYKPAPENLNTDLRISYFILKDLVLSSSFGYNSYELKETLLSPKKAFNPASSAIRTSTFSNSTVKSWIIEPQLEYTRQIAKGKLQLLVGSTWQANKQSSSTQVGRGFLDDVFMENLLAAATVTATNDFSQYRYEAFFGRVNYNWDNRYIINLSGRRDGSTRFAPEKQFTNFGAIGAAWIFTNESFAKNFSFLRFGKLRGSYGTTGNDKIGDYKYLNLWTTITGYQTATSLYPTALYNPTYSWEQNKKLEASLELGFLQDKIYLTTSWYRNRSGNQLINYKLPTQAGFPNVIANFPALVENAGVEIEFRSTNIRTKSFEWNTSINFSKNNNKLLEFPGIETSTYANQLYVGKPLTIVRGYKYLGVDPQTGIYSFEDVDKDDAFTSKDLQPLRDMAPKFIGGVSNNLQYKTWSFSFFFSYKKQLGRNYLSQYGLPAAGNYNPPQLVLDKYWKAPGDQADIQKLTQDPGSEAYTANLFLQASDGIYSDASYIRLKNLQLSYSFPSPLLKKAHLQNLTLFIQGQNLLTITSYQGNDPEAGNFFSVPPLRTLSGGISIKL